MRKTFSDTIEKLATANEKVLFLTGDLGYNALENLRSTMGDRFINAGVAEQNMIGVAAGLAHEGFKVFCYSIAPFIVYRCLEQFRNDVCFHRLPVFLVGNGGGYGYGIMGSSHHALEDIACISGLPNARCYVPAFNDDIAPMVEEMIDKDLPAYFRLGLGKKSPSARKVVGCFSEIFRSENAAVTVITLGPTVNTVLDAVSAGSLQNSIDLFTVQSLPLTLPGEILESIQKTGKLLIAEEHKSIGGASAAISLALLEKNITPRSFVALYAKGYPGEVYGNQEFHQEQSQLNKGHIQECLKRLLND